MVLQVQYFTFICSRTSILSRCLILIFEYVLMFCIFGRFHKHRFWSFAGGLRCPSSAIGPSHARTSTSSTSKAWTLLKKVWDSGDSLAKPARRSTSLFPGFQLISSTISENLATSWEFHGIWQRLHYPLAGKPPRNSAHTVKKNIEHLTKCSMIAAQLPRWLQRSVLQGNLWMNHASVSCEK